MRKKILILFICLSILSCMFLSGCEIKGVPPRGDTLNLLKQMDSYSCDFEIVIKNDKGTISYTGKQYYDKKLGCRIELDGSRIYVYKNDVIYVKDKVSGSNYSVEKNFDEFFKLSIVEEYVNLLYSNESIKYYEKSIDNISYQLVELIIPGTNRSLSKAIMYVDEKTGIPDKILIYDVNGNEKVKITYKNFNTEVKLNSDLFKTE